MAEFVFPSPTKKAFVSEKKAAAFLGVGKVALQRAARVLGWVTRRRQGREVMYATKDIILIAELAQKKNGLPEGIFSRVPRTPQDAPASPSKPQRNRTPKSEDTAQD